MVGRRRGRDATRSCMGPSRTCERGARRSCRARSACRSTRSRRRPALGVDLSLVAGRSRRASCIASSSTCHDVGAVCRRPDRSCSRSGSRCFGLSLVCVTGTRMHSGHVADVVCSAFAERHDVVRLVAARSATHVADRLVSLKDVPRASLLSRTRSHSPVSSAVSLPRHLLSVLGTGMRRVDEAGAAWRRADLHRHGVSLRSRWAFAPRLHLTNRPLRCNVGLQGQANNPRERSPQSGFSSERCPALDRSSSQSAPPRALRRSHRQPPRPPRRRRV